ncbi:MULTISPECIES: hypothetical protein [unclassified Colwellia]|uniref:hypothetical protein n=1 Tax=unclassified Colwellia TaxID=196834 RepID=UPI0015F47E32|nr:MULTISPECIES: hypothetical protein [unclassified Colwellia]MBA6230754.1 hypothetical protein [Colwellia sp. MB02u-7]MBA6234685.1 hypothetical protein [Colwellia sp. MB02u-11]MBA6255548.1 hypothetical protein [Colwellia sp. MB3u-28]MBA6261688.1 hypothetical protein [Colwellia sp. MB3u-41]MBA6301239.1 hypothetical protein [Colwellia sp. MB3u-22]
MKQLIILIFLLSISNNCQAIAIDAVKSHQKIIHFLADNSLTDLKITYQQLDLGDICGFVGCHWRKLVSVIVTSKSANAPSTTIVALVEGLVPDNQNKPTVTFVTLQNSLPNTLVFID